MGDHHGIRCSRRSSRALEQGKIVGQKAALLAQRRLRTARAPPDGEPGSVIASAWFAQSRCQTHPVLRIRRKRCITTLSQQFPLRLMLRTNPWRASSAWCQVQPHRQVQPPAASADVGDVAYPGLVGATRVEAPRKHIGRDRQCMTAVSGVANLRRHRARSLFSRIKHHTRLRPMCCP